MPILVGNYYPSSRKYQTRLRPQRDVNINDVFNKDKKKNTVNKYLCFMNIETRSCLILNLEDGYRCCKRTRATRNCRPT